MTQPAIAIKSLTKYYKDLKALNDVSLEVREGDFFGFLGPNGAGKTTTISVMTGLANFNGGSVKIFGHDVIAEYRKTRALVGFVPQEFNFDPYLSVENILVFVAGYFGIPRRQALVRAHELLELFELTAKRKVDYKKLSGGMKRRLLIARALMHRPKILILDEPTAGVDLELRHQLWGFLKRLNQEGVTLFLTTHYIEEAERLCRHIGVIHEGSIVAMDATGDLIRRISGDLVELYLKDSPARLAPKLAELSVIADAEAKMLRFEEVGDRVTRVLKILHDAGLEVEKIDIRHPTLEDAFLRLTEKKEKNHA
ncbi:MAG TPA: ABC transporter ATP-binding protein [Verrucomicrobiae bacterium]|jgi:ABC-2 type transport system ATP-binding protein|nr:ABC transporter ATP-binding protein [Verrucomicrobiae bacterium]